MGEEREQDVYHRRTLAPHLLEFVRQYRVRWYDIDFAIPEKELAIEVMGCWYHACPERFPEGAVYQTQKLNVRNDKSKRSYLERRGWKILYIWEHDIKNSLEEVLARVHDYKTV